MTQSDQDLNHLSVRVWRVASGDHTPFQSLLVDRHSPQTFALDGLGQAPLTNTILPMVTSPYNPMRRLNDCLSRWLLELSPVLPCAVSFTASATLLPTFSKCSKHAQ